MARILVVDDEEDVRQLLRKFLRKKYEVLTTESGEAALAVLDQEKIDAVLLDIRMPGMGGFESLRRIQRQNPGLPVLMVSGQDDQEVANATLKEGAFDYVMKPLDFDHLERTIYFMLIANSPELSDS